MSYIEGGAPFGAAICLRQVALHDQTAAVLGDGQHLYPDGLGVLQPCRLAGTILRDAKRCDKDKNMARLRLIHGQETIKYPIVFLNYNSRM